MGRPIPFEVSPLRASQQMPQWCEIPVFSQIDGDFAAHYARRFIERTQNLADAPRITERQIAAMDALDELLQTPGLPLEKYVRPGDVQLVNNLHILHARTAYHDEPTTQGRLLLRLHLAFGGSPTLPEGYRPLFGAIEGGTYRGGVWRTPDYQRRLGTPLQRLAAV